MAIQVMQRQPERAPEPKEDPFDKLLKGLQIAQGAFGIYSNIDSLKTNALQRENMQQQMDARQVAQQRADTGVLTPEQQAGYQQQGWQFSSGDEGPQPGNAVQFQTPEGRQLFATPGVTAFDQAKLDQASALAEKNARAAAQKIAKEEKASKLKKEEGLRKEYFKASDDVRTALSGWRKVKAASEVENPTGADDMALVYGFMKTTDPGSAVKEGEFANAENTTGKVDRYTMGLYNQIIKGTRLTPEQRANFRMAAARQMKSQLDFQTDTDRYFIDLAERAGADVEDIIDPRYATAADEIDLILGGGPARGQDPENTQFDIGSRVDFWLQQKQSNVGGR